VAIALGRRGRRAEGNGPGEIRLLALPVRATGATAPAATVVVGLSKEPLEDLQREVLIGSLVVAALILLAGGLAIRSAVDGALRPVADMTASAEDWGAHDLEHRFGLGPPRDELTGLAATLDGLLARIAASRRHEQRFASEVAHELRTPVAGLRGRVELALRAQGPEADAERQAALRAVLEQVDRLGGTIDDLLAMARQELDATTGTVDLLSLARELDDVEINAEPDLPLAEGDPDVVRRALAPLIDNARRHSQHRVAVELSTAGDRVRLAVRDDGPGLEAGMAEHVFEPGFQSGSHAGSAGLGLPLARRLAQSCGGDVSAGEGPGGCFVLELPRAT
jgi:signal transduction histidine kinase